MANGQQFYKLCENVSFNTVKLCRNLSIKININGLLGVIFTTMYRRMFEIIRSYFIVHIDIGERISNRAQLRLSTLNPSGPCMQSHA